MVERRGVLLALLVGVMALPARAAVDLEALTRQVADTERAFARSMAERNHAAFTALLSKDAVFFSANKVLRGQAAVAAGWAVFFDGPTAPFSWQPDQVQVQVLDDGTLALSTGPVRDPAGKVIARFNSIWRQESPGV